jgi:hypothetical protein
VENNGWPARPGVPLNPEKIAEHWLATRNGKPFTAQWEPKYVDGDEWEWRIDGSFDDVEDAARDYTYLGPCLPPAEVAAREAAAWAAGAEAMREMAACACEHVSSAQYSNSTYAATEEEHARAVAAKVCTRSVRALPLPPQPPHD